MKNSSSKEILTVMLAQLKGSLRGYIRVLNMMNRTKRKKKASVFLVAFNLFQHNLHDILHFFKKKVI
jgi:hypothetical protein